MRKILKSWLAIAVLAGLWACSGGGGPVGGGGVGGALDSGSGNYAAGPVSLPAPSTLNKNLIVCENVAGPRVECRGSDGAAPPNAHIKLTVYARFASKGLLDYIVPSAQALVGNTDLCDANAAGAFGAGGDCSVVASAGEKIGICVANESNVCSGPELLITAPVEGGTASGATGTIKSLSVDPDGNVIFGKKEAPRKAKFSWLSLFMGTAQAQAEAPLLNPPAAAGSSCASSPDFVGLASAAYQPPVEQSVTIKQKLAGSETVTDLFRLAGSQADLKAVYSGNIGNLEAYAVAFQNTVILVSEQGLNPFARIVFPAPVKAFEGTTGPLYVALDVPKGKPARFKIAPDSFITDCEDDEVSRALSNPDSFAQDLGYYHPPSEGGYRVPVSIRVNAVAGLYPSDQLHMVYLKHTGFGEAPDDIVGDWGGTIYRQEAPLKDIQILSITDIHIVVAVLDPVANRILFITRLFGGGGPQVTQHSLSGLAETPVAMAEHHGSAVYWDRESTSVEAKLLLLDSGERGAKAILLPVTIGLDGSVTVNAASATGKDLGPIVANELEPGSTRTRDWITYDLITSNVIKFNPSEFVALTH